MNYKKLSIYSFCIVLIFLFFNLFIWEFFTKNILQINNGYNIGDMARIGYITNLTHPRKIEATLKKLHFEPENYDFSKVDILTLGDSFSTGNAGGLNRYYQDYLATTLNINVLNIKKFRELNEIETLSLLANSGFLKNIGVKYVLYESTQRRAVERLTKNINFKTYVTQNEIKEFYNFGNGNIKNTSLDIPSISFINNGNFKFVLYNILYNFSPNGFISKVYQATIDKNLFSIAPYNKFLFYYKDLKTIKYNTKENINLSNKTLNSLAKILNKQDIKLIFMPAVSKYDLYSKYIPNNPYPKDQFFDLFREVTKEYIFVDTKKILAQKLEEGEKDLFYCDDTHWSYKTSNILSLYLKEVVQ